MSKKLELCLAGAGLIGRRHVEVMHRAISDVKLGSIVDPSPEGRSYAASIGVDWYYSLNDMFKASSPHGVIIATPNQVHVENGLECVAAGCPMLIEKPIDRLY